MSSYSYTSFVILDDYIHWIFPLNNYIWLMSSLLILSIFFLLYFYLDILLQVFSYYFLGPSLTNEDIVKMNIERELLKKYQLIKETSTLVCGEDNTMFINTNNVMTKALTFGGQPIIDCASKLLQLLK